MSADGADKRHRHVEDLRRGRREQEEMSKEAEKPKVEDIVRRNDRTTEWDNGDNGLSIVGCNNLKRISRSESSGWGTGLITDTPLSNLGHR